VRAGSLAGQTAWEFTASGSAQKLVEIENVVGSFGAGTNFEKVFKAAGGIFPVVRTKFTVINLANLASARCVDSPGTFNFLYSSYVPEVFGSVGGGFTQNPSIDAIACTFGDAGDGSVGGSAFIDCTLFGGILILGGSNSRVFACSFTTSPAPARYIDVLTGLSNIRIIGNRFTGFTSEAIRIATTGAIIEGNIGCKVLETGAADLNRYAGNGGFDGSTLIGPTSLFENQQTRQTTATPYAVVDTDRMLLIDATAGAKIVDLPLAATAKWRILTVKKIDASGNTVTIDGAGGETIDDAATKVLTVQYQSIRIQSDGTEWWVI
jgi:hypothetical protein